MTAPTTSRQPAGHTTGDRRTARGVGAPGRAAVGARTLRQDRWWVQPAITAAVLLAFVVYGTARALIGTDYFSEPYLSPLFSPCLTTACVAGASHLGQPIGDWWPLSPAVIILVGPLSFRLTCYYYRKAYYRSIWQSPPACAVAEPHRGYRGEARFPLILQNVHRYTLYVALLFNVLLTYDAIIAFKSPEGEWGHLGLGTVILVLNALFLWLYSLSCHSCRHLIGGRINHFSRHPLRYKAWSLVSRLNARHPVYAWISLLWVAGTDFYVYLLASGTISDPRFF